MPIDYVRAELGPNKLGQPLADSLQVELGNPKRLVAQAMTLDRCRERSTPKLPPGLIVTLTGRSTIHIPTGEIGTEPTSSIVKSIPETSPLIKRSEVSNAAYPRRLG